ncbi:Nuclear distribution protein PAC1 [Cyberlindnera fabianii]|uniref:Nuclear distribution protein PAC1 n=1 Tax=Cyberlindnera fabianii TaxID=36022 RepID=A0A1V2LAH4_CYBFA|nr:Nuclear distribution protein PAC1 [Cyberlindnera fabianii]
MSFLSERQRSDLHNSLLNYLKPIVSDQTLEQLRTDLNVSKITDDNDLLPKKWTAILRLQKKITDLESQVQQLSKQSHNSSSLVANGDSELTKFNWAPSKSVRLSHGDSGTGLGLMIGHNQVVETVKFVPMISNKYVDKLNTMEDVNKETYNKLGFKYAVTGGRDDTIKIWLLPVPIIRPHNHPIPSSNPQGTLVKTLIGHKSWVKDLAFHPNGKILVSCSDDKSIKLWDLETGDCVRTLTGHDGFINSIAWAPSIFENDSDKLTDDEEMINDSMRCVFASGGTDQLVKIWD